MDISNEDKEISFDLSSKKMMIIFRSDSFPANSELVVKCDKQPGKVICNGNMQPYIWDSEQGSIHINPGRSGNVAIFINR